MKKILFLLLFGLIYFDSFSQNSNGQNIVDCDDCKVSLEGCKIKMTKSGFWQEATYTSLLKIDYFGKYVVIQNAQQQTLTVNYANVKKPKFDTFDDFVAYFDNPDCLDCCVSDSIVPGVDSVLMINKPLNVFTCYVDTVTLDTFAVTWYEDGSVSAYQYDSKIILNFFGADWVPTTCPELKEAQIIRRLLEVDAEKQDSQIVQLDTLIKKPFSVLDRRCYGDTVQACDYVFTVDKELLGQGDITSIEINGGDVLPLPYPYLLSDSPTPAPPESYDTETTRLKNDLIALGYDVTCVDCGTKFPATFTVVQSEDEFTLVVGENSNPVISQVNCNTIQKDYNLQYLSNNQFIVLNVSTGEFSDTLASTLFEVDCVEDFEVVELCDSTGTDAGYVPFLRWYRNGVKYRDCDYNACGYVVQGFVVDCQSKLFTLVKQEEWPIQTVECWRSVSVDSACDNTFDPNLTFANEITGIEVDGDSILPLNYPYASVGVGSAEAYRLANDLRALGYDVSYTGGLLTIIQTTDVLTDIITLSGNPNIVISNCGIVDSIGYTYQVQRFTGWSISIVNNQTGEVKNYTDSVGAVRDSILSRWERISCDIRSLEIDSAYVVNFPDPTDTVAIRQMDTLLMCLDSLKTLINISHRLDTVTIDVLEMIEDFVDQIAIRVLESKDVLIDIRTQDGDFHESNLLKLDTVILCLDSLKALTSEQIVLLSDTFDVKAVAATSTNGQNQYFRTSTSGSIAAGRYSYSICNVGAANGTITDGVNGVQTISAGQCVSFTGYFDPRTNTFVLNTSMSYDATGTTFSITIKQ